MYCNAERCKPKVIMRTASYYFLFLCFYLSNANIKDHTDNNILDQFDKSAKSLDLSLIKTKWITQDIDHNTKSIGTFNMRYFKSFINKKKWRTGNPVYIFIGGQQPLTRACLSNGLLYELAEETNGVMFAIEHRYYGKSKPFRDVTRENIHYLTSEQALADIANFIRKKIKDQPHFKGSKVVVVGGSYAGNLAAWMRQRHPSLVDAAISSSAPVLAKLDFEGFLETVGDAYKKYTMEKCFHRIREIFQSYRNDLKTDSGRKKLKYIHNICESSDLTNWKNQAEFFDDRMHSLVEITQKQTSYDIESYCNLPVTRFCKKTVGCCRLEFDGLYYERSDLAPVHEGDFWTYQMCNEFGYFLNAPKNAPLNQIIMHVDYSVEICQRLFGKQFTKEYIEDKVKITNKKFGGLTPKVTKVIFVHGEIDPWKTLGVVANLSAEAPVMMIEGASHCNDLYADNAWTTTKAVKQIKTMEKELIKKWIEHKPIECVCN